MKCSSYQFALEFISSSVFYPKMIWGKVTENLMNSRSGGASTLYKNTLFQRGISCECHLMCILNMLSILFSSECTSGCTSGTTSGCTSGTISGCTSWYYFWLLFRVLLLVAFLGTTSGCTPGCTYGYHFKVKRV